jgi:hypothetical protein
VEGISRHCQNVLCRQETSSGLQVAVQLAHLDPAFPIKTEVLDYDDIVEASYVTSHLLFCLLLTTLNLIVLDASYLTSGTQRANNLNLKTMCLNYPATCHLQALVTLLPCQTGLLHQCLPGIHHPALHWPSVMTIGLLLPPHPSC